MPIPNNQISNISKKSHSNLIKHNLILNNNYYINNNNSNITNNKNIPIIVNRKSFSSKRRENQQKPPLNKNQEQEKEKMNYNSLHNYYKIPKQNINKNKYNKNTFNTELNQKNKIKINNNYKYNNNINYKNKKNYNINQIIEYETIKESYTIKHCNCVLEYSFREDQNIDSEMLMEDKSKSIENFNNDKSQMIFEIFDGHGGDEMSSYLQANLAKIYKQNLLLNKGNIILSLKNAFHDADDEMREQLNIEGLGSTGTLVHIIKGLGPSLEVYSANVGDSRVSLISPEHIIRLSCDHRTTDEKEKKRILEAGMEIIDDRIFGTLMLTRIFGNY